MALIDVDKITFSYPGADSTALNGVSLSVETGDMLFLLGTNGSGKTTLLQHLNGLLRPARGTVTFHGQALRRYSDQELFSRVGLVFQDPNDQLFAPTVGEDVIYGPLNLGLPEGEARRRASQALDAVGLPGFERREVRTLSYGQKKRAALAGILAMGPQVLLLDEPTSGIDPVGAVRLMELVRSLNQEDNLTVVVTTHDVDLAAVFATKACLLDAGRVKAAGPVRDVLGNAAGMRAAGLRLPRVAHLAEILGQRGGAADDGLPLTIGQCRQWLEKQRQQEGGSQNAANI